MPDAAELKAMSYEALITHMAEATRMARVLETESLNRRVLGIIAWKCTVCGVKFDGSDPDPCTKHARKAHRMCSEDANHFSIPLYP